MSWGRSLRTIGVDLSQPHLVQVLTSSELRVLHPAIERFLRIAKAEFQYQHHQMADLGYATLLCDTLSVTVDWWRDERFTRQWKDTDLFLEAVWIEPQEDTCGVGTALVKQGPLTVHKGGHSQAENARSS